VADNTFETAAFGLAFFYIFESGSLLADGKVNVSAFFQSYDHRSKHSGNTSFNWYSTQLSQSSFIF